MINRATLLWIPECMAIFELSLLLSDRRNFIFLLTTDVSKSFFKLILNYTFYFSFVRYTLIVFFDTLYVLLTVNNIYTRCMC